MIRDGRIIKYYFVYFIAILAPQILMISNKGSVADTLYKAAVLMIFLISFLRLLTSTGKLRLSSLSFLWWLLIFPQQHWV